MAKSQYTDSITGQVVFDIRAVDNKIVDITGIPWYARRGNLIEVASTGKFSSYSLNFPTPASSDSSIKTYEKAFYKSILLGYQYTLSFWGKFDKLPEISNNHHAYTSAIFLADDRGSNWYFSPVIADSGRQNGFYRIATGISNNWTNENNVLYSSVPMNSNSWEHYAIVVNNSNIKVYKNGTLLVETNTLSSVHNTKRLYLQFLNQVYTSTVIPSTLNSYIDDFVFINNQCLWTSNFTVPNYYLTGDHEQPKKISHRSIVYPIPSSLNDYFDKAYLY